MMHPALQESPVTSPLTDLLEQIETALRLRNPKLRSSLLIRARQSAGLSRDRFTSLVHLFQTGGAAMSLTDFEQNFSCLVDSFEAIAALKSRLRQEYALSQTASSHGLPRAEFRRLYRIWLVEAIQQAINGGQI